MTRWRIELLAKQHDCVPFDCGDNGLNTFLRIYARQNARRNISRTYVALPETEDTVCGFFTLCSGSLSFEALPEAAARKIPRYPVPIAHIGRLAVAMWRQGQGLGGLMLTNAMSKIIGVSRIIGIHAVTVRALDEKAKEFYLSLNFVPLRDDPLSLYLPISSISGLASP